MGKSRKSVGVNVGDVFAFRLPDGRYGACRVLRREGDDMVVVAASPWVGDAPPAVETPELREVLRLTHHFYRGEPRIVAVEAKVPQGFTRVGSLPPTPEEAAAACNTYAGWSVFPEDLHLQWRWDHDRDAVLAEDEQRRREREAAAEVARRAYRPAGPSLAELRGRTPFKGWVGYAEPPALRASRKAARDAVAAVAALGPAPHEAMVLDVLRACTERFNDIQDEYDLDIDTICREDIVELLWEIADAAGASDYGGAVAAYRDW